MPTVESIFSLEYGHSLELNRLQQSTSKDAINFVGRAARNNGVTSRVKRIRGVTPFPAGLITVALNGQGGAGVAFLQPFPFYTGFHVMVLRPKQEMSEQEKLWWVFCITANRYRFGFGRQANRTLAVLEVPQRKSMPQWVSSTCIDRYTGAAESATKKRVKLPSATEWKPFRLDELFEIRKGRRLTKAKMSKGETPFIGASDTSNGVTNFVGQSPIHDGNTISVSYNGSVAEAFYQPVPFWATDDVNVLYPRDFELTPSRGLFICAVIRLEKYRFNYGRKWHLERMRDSIIRLPTTSDGRPDWSTMEDYIDTLPFSSQIGSCVSNEMSS